MTKSELIDRVAERVQLPKYQTAMVVTLVLRCMMDALRAGDKVELRGFGSFRLRRRHPRVGRNPKTGDTVQGDRILIPSIDVDWRLADDRISGPWVFDQCSTLLLLPAI